MTITFRCPSCHTAFRAEDSSLGKAVICPNPRCNRKAVLPASGGTKLGRKKLAERSRLQQSTKTEEPIAEKSAVASQAVHRHQLQSESSTSMSNEVRLVVGIGGTAVILICFLWAFFLFRNNTPDKFSSVVATNETPPIVGPAVESQLPDLSRPDLQHPPESSPNSASPSKETKDSNETGNQTEASGRKMSQLPSLTVEEVASRTEASIAFIEGQTGTGTGFLIHEGIVATNQHVIEEELIEQLKIHFPSAPAGQRGPLTAELIYKDPDKDLAFLKVVTSLKPLTTPAEHSFRRGQEVIVIGNPGIGNQVLQNAVNTGVLSTEVTIDGQRYYQMGISINAGNSGGPVLDMTGQVLGVATLGWKGTDGLAACVPLPQLTEAWAKAQNFGESEITVNRSEHRLGAVVRTVSKMANNYQNAMRSIVSIGEASKSGKTNSSGLEQVRDEVKRIMMQDRWLVDADLSRAASHVSSDQNIPDRIREQFADLWTNYKEMKSNVENPRGTFETFNRKFLQLSDKHDRLMHALNLHLGIKDE